MFNLYQIVTSAQGGQGIDNLAQQFGLTREQADSAVRALMPALSTAFMTNAMHPGGLGTIATAMTDDAHKAAYADPGAAQDPTAQQKGGAVAGSLFGNSVIAQQVVRQASQYTGIPAETIERMLPVVVSMVLGGVATAMHNQGIGGILGQIAAGLGGGAGQMPGQAPGSIPGAPAGGGFGGMFGSILSSMFGGAPTGQGPAASPPPPPSTPGAAPAGMPPAFQAGMDALSRMFQPGVHPQPGQPGTQSDLSAEIASILGGKR